MDFAKLMGMPVNASAHGAGIDFTMLLVHNLMLVLFLGWGAFFIYCLVRFRKSQNPTASYSGVHSHFSTWLEGGLAVIEIVFLVALAFPIWASVKGKAPAESDAEVVVSVVAQQFAWNIHYPGADGQFGRRDINLVDDDNVLGLDRTDPKAKDDITTINQLNLPVDKMVLVKLTTQDVIHSFTLNEMRVKQDAIPGMEIPVYFKPIKTGNWEIACAQLCGLGHYRMRGFLNIQSDADYATWTSEQLAEMAQDEEGGEAAEPASSEADTLSPSSSATPADTSQTTPH